MKIVSFRKQSNIKAFYVTLLSFLFIPQSFAQTSVQGGWGDFGIQNRDTIISMDCKELVTNNRAKLFYADFRQNFDISMAMCFHTLVTEQAFLCKEGRNNEMFADLTIGYDPGFEQIFAEIKDRDGRLHRIVAGSKVTKGKWFDVRVTSTYNEKKQQSELVLTVKATDNGYKESKSVSYKGFALPYNVTRWVVGHGFPGGFPNSLQVRNGEIKNLVIQGTGKKHIQGQNPIFTDRFTADPACTVIGDKIYAYVGEDNAGVGGWFNMSHWIAYSSSDMIHWECHGSVLKAADFPNANPNGAWAAQVVEKDGKYYYYITLDDIHDGSYMLNGEPGGDCRRQVCVENMKFNKDGTIQPITLTEKGIAKYK